MCSPGNPGLPKNSELTGDNRLITEADLCDLGSYGHSLPYMTHVEIVKCAPHHFNLDKWESPFRIPDSFMKRLYVKQAYIDTDVDTPEETEQLTSKQQTVLSDWLRENRFKNGESDRKSRCRPPLDNILGDLSHPYNRLDLPLEHVRDICKASSDDVEQAKPLDKKIALCFKHKIQPSEMIVKIAIDKMTRLTPSQEKDYQKLIKDKDFMDHLNEQVEKYVKGSKGN